MSTPALNIYAHSHAHTHTHAQMHTGKAIADYWGVGDDTIVFVADPSFGDILNFNVGSVVDLEVPRRFW